MYNAIVSRNRFKRLYYMIKSEDILQFHLAEYHMMQGEKGRAGELISWIELYMLPVLPDQFLPLYYKLLGDLSLGRKSRFTAYRFYSVSHNLRPAEDIRERMEGLEGHHSNS